MSEFKVHNMEEEMQQLRQQLEVEKVNIAALAEKDQSIEAKADKLRRHFELQTMSQS